MNSLHMQSVGGWHDIARDTAYFPLVTHERKSTNHIAEDGCISLVNARYEITIIPTTIRCQLYCVCFLQDGVLPTHHPDSTVCQAPPTGHEGQSA